MVLILLLIHPLWYFPLWLPFLLILLSLLLEGCTIAAKMQLIKGYGVTKMYFYSRLYELLQLR